MIASRVPVFALAFTVLILAALAAPRDASAQATPAGRWEGVVSFDGQPVKVVLTLTAKGSLFEGALDIPEQNLRGLPLANVGFEPPRLRFEMSAGGLSVFNGTLQRNMILGTIVQGKREGTFELRRAAAAGTPAAPPSSATKVAVVPAPPKSAFTEEEVQIKSGEVALAGTLTRPRTGTRHPAVVLLSTHGPHTRDGEMYGFQMMRELAEHLAGKGFAVLRSDDRGAGKSTGTPLIATTADLAADALALVQFLGGRSDIDAARIGLLGHGEGGVVAALAASRSPKVAFVVSMSAPAVPGEKILLGQAQQINRSSGLPEARIKRNAETQRMLFAAVRTGQGWEKVEAAIAGDMKQVLDAMPAERRASLGNPDAAIESAVAERVKSTRNPWFKFFLDYDPETALAKLTCPVLALYAELDVEVSAAVNKPAAERALEGSKQPHEVRLVPKANHLYQSASTGNVTEYGTLPKSFAPGVLDQISTWMLKVKSSS